MCKVFMNNDDYSVGVRIGSDRIIVSGSEEKKLDFNGRNVCYGFKVHGAVVDTQIIVDGPQGEVHKALLLKPGAFVLTLEKKDLASGKVLTQEAHLISPYGIRNACPENWPDTQYYRLRYMNMGGVAV